MSGVLRRCHIRAWQISQISRGNDNTVSAGEPSRLESAPQLPSHLTELWCHCALPSSAGVLCPRFESRLFPVISSIFGQGSSHVTTWVRRNLHFVVGFWSVGGSKQSWGVETTKPEKSVVSKSVWTVWPKAERPAENKTGSAQELVWKGRGENVRTEPGDG